MSLLPPLLMDHLHYRCTLLFQDLHGFHRSKPKPQRFLLLKQTLYLLKLLLNPASYVTLRRSLVTRSSPGCVEARRSISSLLKVKCPAASLLCSVGCVCVGLPSSRSELTCHRASFYSGASSSEGRCI